MKVIGIDIGGTAVKGAVVNELGNCLKEVELPTDIKRGKDSITKSLEAVIHELLKEHSDCRGIGIGTAGRVNADTGEIVFATANLPGWQGTTLGEYVKALTGLPVKVDNDANAALLGELWRGSHGNPHSAVMLTLGTGVGGANYINGSLSRGNGWNGGEYGHTILVPGGISCNCGLAGCVEQYVSGSAFVKAANKTGRGGFVHGAEVFDASNHGHPEARAAVENFIYYLGLTLYNVSAAIDPHLFILGGGVIHSSNLWWGALEKELRQYPIPINIHPASLGNKAGIYGAAKLIQEEVLGRCGV